MAPIHKLILILLLAIICRSVRKYLAGCVCSMEGRIDDRLALVIGADTDIGVMSVRALARRGAKVVMACQVLERCRTQRELLIKEFAPDRVGSSSTEMVGESKLVEDTLKTVTPIRPDQLYVRQLHLSSAAAIKKFCQRFAKEFGHLNILVVNAVHLETKPDRTVDGFERNMGLNYVASFLITQHLLPLMEASATPDSLSRLVFVSSRLHKYGELPTALNKQTRVNTASSSSFKWWKAYTSSHLALITYANYLNTRVNNSKMRIVSVHPGFENRHFSSILYQPFAYLATWLGKTPWQSTQTTLYTVLMKPGEAGVFFSDCKSTPPHPDTFNTEGARELVKITKAALKPFLPSDAPKTTKSV